MFGFFFLFDNGKLIKLYDENSLLFAERLDFQLRAYSRTSKWMFLRVVATEHERFGPASKKQDYMAHSAVWRGRERLNVSSASIESVPGCAVMERANT